MYVEHACCVLIDRTNPHISFIIGVLSIEVAIVLAVTQMMRVMERKIQRGSFYS